MKKIIAITLLFMILLSSVCMAYTPDPEEWELLGESDGYVYYNGKQFQCANNTYYVWIIPADSGDVQPLVQCAFNNLDETYACLWYFLFSTETKQILGPYRMEEFVEWRPIEKGSVFEKLYHKILYNGAVD